MKGIVPRVIPEMLIYALFGNQVIDEGGRPKIQVEYKAETKTFFAEEVCISSQSLQSFAIPQLYFRSVNTVTEDIFDIYYSIIINDF